MSMVNSASFGLICPFFVPMNILIVPMAKMKCVSLENGLHNCSVCCATDCVIFTFFCGEPSSKSIDELRKSDELFTRRTKFNLVMHQTILKLHDSDMQNPVKMSRDEFDSKHCFDKDRAKTHNCKSFSCMLHHFISFSWFWSSIKICWNLQTRKRAFWHGNDVSHV